MKAERLDKIIASTGKYSRSDVRRLVKSGAVAVDGKVVSDFSLKTEYGADIAVNGVSLDTSEHIYIMLNKPQGVVSASDDGKDTTVVDILPDDLKRKNLFPAGRLDKDTVGFCLITDDGDFAHRILAPAHHVDKTYIAQVSEPIDFESAKRAFAQGVVLADGTVLLSAELCEISAEDRIYKVIIREGRYHQVKRMFASLGTSVTSLERVAIGGLELDTSLKRGEARLITAAELLRIVENNQ